MKRWTHWRRITGIKKAKSCYNPTDHLLLKRVFPFSPLHTFSPGQIMMQYFIPPYYSLLKMLYFTESLRMQLQLVYWCLLHLWLSRVQMFSRPFQGGAGMLWHQTLLCWSWSWTWKWCGRSHVDNCTWLKWSGQGWSSGFCLTSIWVNMSSIAIKWSRVWFKGIMCMDDCLNILGTSLKPPGNLFLQKM